MRAVWHCRNVFRVATYSAWQRPERQAPADRGVGRSGRTMAVAEGFEPSEALTSHAFEACSLGRSDTPPPRTITEWAAPAGPRWDRPMVARSGVRRRCAGINVAPLGLE